MAWRFKDFTFLKGTVNRFEIWAWSDYDTYDVCKVTAYCSTEAGIRWASQTLYRVGLSTLKSPEYKHEVHLVSKKSTKAGPNYGKTEISAILQMSPTAATAAMVSVGVPPEADTITLKPGALSVGPCAHRNNHGTYVKVRFNGYSVPFFYDKEKQFVPSLTEQAITREVGGVGAEAVFKVVVDNKDIILKRAIARPLNLSEIEDSAEHNLKILKGDGKGKYFSATPAEIADPTAELATVFVYDRRTGGSDSFAIIDNELYKVKGFITGWHMFNGYGENYLTQDYDLDYHQGSKIHRGFMRREDCEPLDPEDQFVREKIQRSMKKKL